MNSPPGHLVLELTCVLEAARERVFDALTQPTALAKWWGPSGFTTPAIELDLRERGRYRFSMQPPDGELFHVAGQFLEIDPPSRLAYTFRWEPPDPEDQDTVVDLALDATGDGTQVTLVQREFATEARLALHRSGWTETFQKLRQLVEAGG